MSTNKFFKCYYEILQDKTLKESEKRLLIALLGIRNTQDQQLLKNNSIIIENFNYFEKFEIQEDPDIITATIDYLILISFLNRSTIFKALDSLNNKGFIKIKKRKSKYLIKIKYKIKNDLWLRIDNELMEDCDYTWGEKLVYSYYISLSQLYNSKNGWNLTLKAMSNILGISNNTVKNARLNLINKKILKQNQNGISLIKKQS